MTISLESIDKKEGSGDFLSEEYSGLWRFRLDHGAADGFARPSRRDRREGVIDQSALLTQ